MTESLRVLLISSRYPPAIGGVESHVSGLAKVLDELGHDVTVLTTDVESFHPRTRVETSTTVTNERPRVIRTRSLSLDPGANPILAISPRQIVVPEGVLPDIVHVHSLGFFSSTLPALSPFYSRFPMVLTAHSTPDTPLPRWVFDQTLGLRVVRRMSCVIALTKVEERFLRTLIQPPTELCVIPNGIDSRGLRSFASYGQGQPAPIQPPYVLYAGRLAPNKGLDILLRAFSVVSKVHPDLRLCLVGPDFGMRTPLGRLAFDLGIQVKVDFMGELDHPAYVGVLCHADCLVLPSTYGESQGIVLLEALTLGTPVIGTRIGGVPETLDGGRLGRIVTPGSLEELAAALTRLVMTRRAGSSPPCELVAMSKYDWSRVGREVAATYRRAMDTFNS